MLLSTTGNAKVDAILQGVIDIYESRFPGRIRGCYLYGSYAAGNALPTSDIDLVVLFAQDFSSQAEQDAAWELSRACEAICSYELDVVPYSEHTLEQSLRARVLLKRASICVYGDDVRPELVLPQVTTYAREVTYGLYIFLAGIRGHPKWLRFPLAYPDANDLFYGYARTEVDPRTATPHASTRSLLRLIWPLAGAMVTVQSRAFSGGKYESLTGYQALFHDTWGDWLTMVWHTCREQWQYTIPDSAKDQQELRTICARTLDFENHFLQWYRLYLINDLTASDPPIRKQALQQLSRVLYSDPEIAQMLEGCIHEQDPEVRRLAEEAQQTIKTAFSADAR